MKTPLAAALLAAVCPACFATEVVAGSHAVHAAALAAFEVERLPFGSGTPANAATHGTEAAHHVADGLYHVPNHMPGFPTAATIWPREVPLECESDTAHAPRCSGYRIWPAIGRGEYVFVRPYLKPKGKAAAAPALPPVEPIPATHKKPLE